MSAPQLRRPAAGGEAEREVFLRALTRQQLQQGDSQSGHGRASFFRFLRGRPPRELILSRGAALRKGEKAPCRRARRGNRGFLDLAGKST